MDFKPEDERNTAETRKKEHSRLVEIQNVDMTYQSVSTDPNPDINHEPDMYMESEVNPTIRIRAGPNKRTRTRTRTKTRTITKTRIKTRTRTRTRTRTKTRARTRTRTRTRTKTRSRLG